MIAQVIAGAVATAGVVSAVIGVLGYRLQARQANRQAREFLALLLEARSVDAFSFYWANEPYVFLDTTKSG